MPEPTAPRLVRCRAHGLDRQIPEDEAVLVLDGLEHELAALPGSVVWHRDRRAEDARAELQRLRRTLDERAGAAFAAGMIAGLLGVLLVRAALLADQVGAAWHP